MRIETRALQFGDGAPLAELWRQLWLLHEQWGGYETDPEEETFQRVAVRLDRDALERRGAFVSGKHLHLVAIGDGEVLGQVEGWLDRYGFHRLTQPVCEVRSLIVHEKARGKGVGRALMRRLEEVAEHHLNDTVTFAAEVLLANPGMQFYSDLGYRKASWTMRKKLTEVRPPKRNAMTRKPKLGDEVPIAMLESSLAERRRRHGDVRYDPPQSVDASWISVIRRFLGNDSLGETNQNWVACSPLNAPLGMVSTFPQRLEPPFRPGVRMLASKFFAFHEAKEIVLALAAKAEEEARVTGCSAIEVVDLPPFSSTLATLLEGEGYVPWSILVQK